LKFDSHLAALTAYLIDISLFEELSVECGIGGVLSEIYRRQDDGCLIVVNSMSLSESVENREITQEIEKEVNVLYPCISVLIGFVLPAESSELWELKIVPLFVEGCSLAEVILTNPVWWTPTMKAKVVAGIVLGLRFVHSFGLIYGNWNSNNILLDDAHRIQMIGFGRIDLEVQEGECARESELFDEEWTAQADIRAFGSLLVEITVGQPLILAGDRDSEGTVQLGVSRLVSEIIEKIQSKSWNRVHSLNSIMDILKRNKFQIEAGVDSEEVLEFARWVEFMEQSSE
jgi:serine/threonine protein kinase